MECNAGIMYTMSRSRLEYTIQSQIVMKNPASGPRGGSRPSLRHLRTSTQISASALSPNPIWVTSSSAGGCASDV